MISSKLNQKVVVITGASSGIGEATARKLGSLGANLVLAARRIDRLHILKEVLEKDGIKVIVVKTDVTKRKDLEALMEQGKQEFGKIDVLINNAGIMPNSMMKNLRVDEWDQMIDVNLKGTLYGIAAALPIFRQQKSGHIINISSVSGRRVYPGGVVYSATKFGVRVISEGLRAELDPAENIKITVVEPGAVRSELMNSISDPEAAQKMAAWTGSFTRLEPEDIAESLAFALTRADRVNVDEILIMPREQTR